MGALILLGFFPGPELFERNPDVVGGIFLAYMAANVALRSDARGGCGSAAVQRGPAAGVVRVSKIMFVGDVHGLLDEYRATYRKCEMPVVQVGDLGLGFVPDPVEIPVGHKFIRGNHDDPARARAHSAHLGDYGFNAELGLFFVGGAWSIDHLFRTPGADWWADEELSSADGREGACRLQCGTS